MTGNIAAKGAAGLIRVLVVVSIALALLGYDPNAAVDAFVPLFVLLVFAAVVIGLIRTAMG